MRSFTKTVLLSFAGLATAAALVTGGAGVASAATTTATTSHNGYYCNPWAWEQWNLNGSNTVNAVYNGNTYSYSITFNQYGSCLSGTLTDSYYPTTGPIHGTINGNHVVFSFTYPSGSVQGTRTFNGYIQAQWYRQWYRHWVWNGWRWVQRWTFRWQVRGYVSGQWTETGSEAGSGAWSLANAVRPLR
jgi:hypothetical protein